MNIKLGKEIFFKCYGNSFVVEREYGKEYKKCKIPKEYENQWRIEIQRQLYNFIYETKSESRYSYFLLLCDIISVDDAIKLNIKILNYDLDFFERLLYTEYLKHLNKFVSRLDLKKEIINNKITLLNNNALVKLHAKKYSFVDETKIIERINNL